MYKIITRDDIFKRFNTETELIDWLNKSKYSVSPWCSYRDGVDKLHERHDFLCQCCHNWNDKNFEGVFEYMIIDPFNRIMNIPDLAHKAYNFKDTSKKLPYRHSYFHYKWKPEKNSKWELYKRRWKHKGGNYYRKPRVQQERRYGSSIEHKPFIRPKRRPHTIDPWNIEKHQVIQTSWKGVKCKKQWEEKLLFVR